MKELAKRAGRKEGAHTYHVESSFEGKAGCDHRITLVELANAGTVPPDRRCKRAGCDTAWPPEKPSDPAA